MFRLGPFYRITRMAGPISFITRIMCNARTQNRKSVPFWWTIAITEWSGRRERKHLWRNRETPPAIAVLGRTMRYSHAKFASRTKSIRYWFPATMWFCAATAVREFPVRIPSIVPFAERKFGHIIIYFINLYCVYKILWYAQYVFIQILCSRTLNKLQESKFSFRVSR